MSSHGCQTFGRKFWQNTDGFDDSEDILHHGKIGCWSCVSRHGAGNQLWCSACQQMDCFIKPIRTSAVQVGLVCGLSSLRGNSQNAIKILHLCSAPEVTSCQAWAFPYWPGHYSCSEVRCTVLCVVWKGEKLRIRLGSCG